ncbi:MAG: prepilin-type N-terminal cleavage/methylation domain-containing protein [Candidatus Moranbacteria bacterium]|nr:prepilin-type N-terminal cleavage/methylation domain-containing protein [Candidatus Moranbacteria bacterium]
MNTKQKKQSGFTLIETLVVIAIIGLLLAIVGLNLNKNRQRKKAEATAITIKQAIETARDFALTGEAIETDPGVFKLPGSGEGYEVKISCTNPSDCEVQVGNAILGAADHKVFELEDYDKNEMKISPDDLYEIKFIPPHGNLKCSSPSSCDPLNIEVCGDTNCGDDSLKYTLEVTEYGVSMQ